MTPYLPPRHPTLLKPDGARVTLPKPTLIIDTREQQPYTFASYRHWFAGITRATLATGDYSSRPGGPHHRRTEVQSGPHRVP